MLSNVSQDLQDIRKQINQIDNKLLALLAERRALAKAVANSKIAQDKPVRDTGREEQMLIALIEKGAELELDGYFVK